MNGLFDAIWNNRKQIQEGMVDKYTKALTEKKTIKEGQIPDDKDNEATKIKKLMEDEESCKSCSGPLSRCPSCTNMSYCEKCKKCNLHPIVQPKDKSESVNEQGLDDEERREPDAADNSPDFDDLHDKMKDNSEEDGTPKPPVEEPGESEAAKEKEMPEKEYLGKTEDDTFYYLNHGDDGLHITDAEGKIVYPKKGDKEEDHTETELAAGDEPIPDTEELQFIIKAQQELEMVEISADILTRYVQPALDVVSKEREEEEGFEFETPPGEGGLGGEEGSEEAAEGETPEEEAEEGPEGEEEEEEEELDADGKPKPKKKKIGTGEQPITIESIKEEKFDQHDKDEMADQLFDKPYKELSIQQQTKVTNELDKLYKSPKLGEKVNEVKVVFNGHTYDVMLEADMGEGGIHIKINGQGPYHFTAPFVEMFGRDKNGGLTEDSIKELGQSALSAMNSTHLEKVAAAYVTESKEEAKYYKVVRKNGGVHYYDAAGRTPAQFKAYLEKKGFEIKSVTPSKRKYESKVEEGLSFSGQFYAFVKDGKTKSRAEAIKKFAKKKGMSPEDVKKRLKNESVARLHEKLLKIAEAQKIKDGKIPDDKDKEQTKIAKLMEMKKKLSERNWKFKIALPFLAPIFYGDQEEYDVGVIAAKVSAALEKFIASKPGLHEVYLNRLTDIKDELDNIDLVDDKEEDEATFNNIFNDLYNLGDSASIWIDTMTGPGETPAGEQKKEAPPQKPENEAKVQEVEATKKDDKTAQMNELIKQAREIITKGKSMTDEDYSKLGQLTGEMSKHMSLGLHTASEAVLKKVMEACTKLIEEHESIKVGDYIQVKDKEGNTTIVPSAKVHEMDMVEEDAEEYPTYEVTGSTNEDEQEWYSTKDYIIRKVSGPVGESKVNEGADENERFEEIIQEIQELTQEAYDIVRHSGNKSAAARAEAYWFGHIMSAAGSDEYQSGSATNMRETLEELQEDEGEIRQEEEDDDEERRNRTGTSESIKEGLDAVGRIDAFRDALEGIRTAAHQIDHDLMKISNKRLANRFLTFVTSELKNLTSSKAWRLYNQVEQALKAGPTTPKDDKKKEGKEEDKKTDESITEDTDVAKIEPFKSDTELASAIRKDIMAEQEAIALYQTHADATDNPQAKKLLTDIGEEEQVHVGELTKLLSMIQPKDDSLHDKGEEEAEDKVGSKEEKPVEEKFEESTGAVCSKCKSPVSQVEVDRGTSKCCHAPVESEEEEEMEESKKEETPKDKLINPAFCSKCGKAMKSDDLVNGMSKCCGALTSLDAPGDKDDGKGNLTKDPQEPKEPISTEEVDKAVKTKTKESKVNEEEDDEDNDSDVIYAIVTSDDKESLVKVSKEGGEWGEELLGGPEPYGFGGKRYMSYLKPDDIMSWLRKDYEDVRAITEEEADEWLEDNKSRNESKGKVKGTSVTEMLNHLDSYQSKEGESYEEKF